jgi:protoheme IX farnesyltransferase
MMIMKSRVLYVAHGKKDKGTALQVILYTVWLILASLLPVLGYTENYL